jgi:hypothetical protein
MEMALDSSSMELIRRQTLVKAATDLRRAANSLDDLSEVRWPTLARDIEGARLDVALVRVSLAVVDQVGWPSGND